MSDTVDYNWPVDTEYEERMRESKERASRRIGDIYQCSAEGFQRAAQLTLTAESRP